MTDTGRASGAPDHGDPLLDEPAFEALVATNDPAVRAMLLSSWGDSVRRASVDDTGHAQQAWHLSLALMRAGAAAGEPSDTTVDEYALTLAGRAGLRVDAAALDRSKRAAADPDVWETGRSTMRDLVSQGALGPEALRRALLAAYDDLDVTRRARDQAQADAVDLVTAKALAQSLGEELERDEWIRARLRHAKATRPAKAVIAARRRLATRRSR
jgi:hypothetical protein